MVLVQLNLYCLFYMGPVKLYAGNSAVNVLYFYPKPVQERAIALDLANAEAMARKRKQFLLGFSIAMLTWAVIAAVVSGLVSIAKEILTAHRAKFGVDNRNDCTFWFELQICSNVAA